VVWSFCPGLGLQTLVSFTPVPWAYLDHTQLALVLFSQLSAAVVRHRANGGVVYAIRAWLKYDTALSAVV